MRPPRPPARARGRARARPPRGAGWRRSGAGRSPRPRRLRRGSRRGSPARPSRSSGRRSLPVLCQPPRDLAPEIAGHERRRLLVVEVEVVRTVPARDLERVAEALGRDQPGLDALPLRQRVDHERRAMGEERDLAESDAALRHHVHHALLEVRRRRVCLRRHDLLDAGLGVRGEVHEVRERAADVGRCPDPPVARAHAVTAPVRPPRASPGRARRRTRVAPPRRLTKPSRTSMRTRSGSRSRGAPKPPPPPVCM